MTEKKHRRWKRLGIALLILVVILSGLVIWFRLATRLDPPPIADHSPEKLTVERQGNDFYRIGSNWLQKGAGGLWEMYLEGNPYERGVINGKLSKHLIDAQEEAFIGQISRLIPSGFYLRFLKYFIYWFNRDLDKYIPVEYLREIYGISGSASSKYSFIGTSYKRMLNYHSAHDIGHALQDYRLVGCTSFGVWGKRTKDSTLLVGRNFDFYVGDEFAANKMVCFIKPDSGHPFMMITWGGMIGAVSGMNSEGLTVTINAAKSEIPTEARTPISILAREILQYASNIREARAIASRRETFVSESILVGSAHDGKAAIIEKSPSRMDMVTPSGDYIACANHFQSAAFAEDPGNIENRRENASAYRLSRLLEDIRRTGPMDQDSAAAILRDQKGLGGKDIGMGNEKAMNQLIAHHSVIFMPQKRLVWVSTSPWQVGPYVCYDLTKIFHTFAGLQQKTEVNEQALAIPQDPFLASAGYKNFLDFRRLKKELEEHLKSGDNVPLPGCFIDALKSSNPEYYESYSLAGDYWSAEQEWDKAVKEYETALTKEIPRLKERETILKKLAECNRKMKKPKR